MSRINKRYVSREDKRHIKGKKKKKIPPFATEKEQNNGGLGNEGEYAMS